MTGVELFLGRYFLPKLLSRNCGNEIPRSGKQGERVDCFSINIDDNGAPFVWVRSIAGDELVGLQWDGTSFSIEKSLNLKTVEGRNLFIRHYYGLAEVRYSGIFDLAFGRIARWPYIKITAARILNHFDQSFFNKKKLVTKERIDLLKSLRDLHLDGKTPIDSIDLMIELYSQKWLLHPEGDAQHRKLEVYLESLVESGDVQKTDYRYSLSRTALQTIEKYEEEERRHTESVMIQRRMFWIALAVALLTCVQAGLIKLPVLLDLSAWSPLTAQKSELKK